ncbi:cytochrome P450 [Trametes meyenii]|nr:cytochrome P450 [Trametes meyenii]
MSAEESTNILTIPASVGLIHQSPLGLALVLFGLYWLSKILRPTDPSRPPIAKYWIPWLGSAVEMGKDPDGFFTNMTQLLGPIFRVKTLGQQRIFVTSPSLISTVYRDSQNFDFLAIRVELGEIAFSLDTKLGREPYMLETYMPAFHHALLPTNLRPMIDAYVSSAHDCVRGAVANLNGSAIPLASFIAPPAYHSAAFAGFGAAFPIQESYPLFRAYDDYFHMLASGLPRVLFSKPLNAWDKLVDLIEAYVDRIGDNIDEAPHYTQVALRARENGWTNRFTASVLSTQLWALQANAVWAAYWLIALLLQEPEGLAPLIAEVDSVRRSWVAAHPSTPLSGFFEDVALGSSKSLPLLTSAIQETLRYTSQTFSIRQVVNPVRLGGFDLRTGEQVVCVTRQVHMDEEIHPSASVFDIRRYLDGPKAMKDGKLVANHSMPFGGGVSMCEGRHFAMSELKTFIAMLLTYSTLELDPASTSRPEFAWERIGAGIMHPRGDVQVIVRKRQL